MKMTRTMIICIILLIGCLFSMWAFKGKAIETITWVIFVLTIPTLLNEISDHTTLFTSKEEVKRRKIVREDEREKMILSKTKAKVFDIALIILIPSVLFLIRYLENMVFTSIMIAIFVIFSCIFFLLLHHYSKEY